MLTTPILDTYSFSSDTVCIARYDGLALAENVTATISSNLEGNYPPAESTLYFFSFYSHESDSKAQLQMWLYPDALDDYTNNSMYVLDPTPNNGKNWAYLKIDDWEIACYVEQFGAQFSQSGIPPEFGKMCIDAATSGQTFKVTSIIWDDNRPDWEVKYKGEKLK